jgi:hypothetical protein
MCIQYIFRHSEYLMKYQKTDFWLQCNVSSIDSIYKNGFESEINEHQYQLVMQSLKDRIWKICVDLLQNRSFQFRITNSRNMAAVRTDIWAALEPLNPWCSDFIFYLMCVNENFCFSSSLYQNIHGHVTSQWCEISYLIFYFIIITVQSMKLII